MAAKAVLVATETDDVTADMVITELNARNVPVARFNPASIGTDLTVCAHFGSGTDAVAGQLRTPSRIVDLTRVRSVYWRRPIWPAFDHLAPDDARFAAAQVHYGLGGILHALDQPLWVNHPLKNAAADYKPTQLAVAHRMGFTVPPTLVTNDPDQARSFINAHQRVLFKTLRWTPYQRNGVPVTGWADPVTAGELDESVRAAPHLFQAVVDKAADLRVLVVGRKVFAVRIESKMLDWRKDYAALSYSMVDLPERTEKALLAYLDHFGLVSGSFDLAVDKASGLWWLELNPNGQWGWLQEPTGLPMAAAFAELLTQGASP
ncbi:ATP-grasp ribosomal peptide maturase [Streptomyces aureocirculatus]|uniref:ATP-grasp ribosomal peptide maturase n=1 Tax=Streptomyces aureocirculatus TaxID=67275 RepID=UPI0004CBCECD|nr:ATP-grasp ribosomal peptide maturase [Streptomyces aureocirculatus]